MRLKYLVTLFAIIALSLAATACSSSDDDSSNDGDQPTSTTEAPDGDGDGDQPTATTEADDGDGDGAQNPFGSGQATLTIGDQMWEFDGIFCAFSPEEAQSERISFTLTSFGESSTGARTQLDASIYDPQAEGRYEGDDVSHSVTLDDVEDFENPSVSWGALSLFGSSNIDIQVDGKNVSVEAVFDDGTTDEIESVPGTLSATCP